MDKAVYDIEQPILVTGATGLIGRVLVDRLLKEQFEIHVFVLPTDHIPIRWEGRVRIHWGDIRERRYVKQAMENCQTVFHLAAVIHDWKGRNVYQEINVDGTSHVLEIAAQKGIRAVLTSGVAVYGTDLRYAICHEERPHGPAVGYYSQSQQAQERIALKLIKEAKLKCSILRPASVYGPGSRTWVHRLIEAMKNGPTLLGDGHQNAGLVHVKNVVEMLMLLATHPAALGEIYNGAEENNVSWKQYQTDLSRIAHTPPPRHFIKEISWPLANLQENIWRALNLSSRPHFTREAINRILANHRIPIDKIKNELGYKEVISYQEGMQELASYLNKQYQKPSP
ncbi:MAG: NAD-dependent epimerase/dehydratase family protein [Bacteroidota bacterium]